MLEFAVVLVGAGGERDEALEQALGGGLAALLEEGAGVPGNSMCRSERIWTRMIRPSRCPRGSDSSLLRPLDVLPGLQRDGDIGRVLISPIALLALLGPSSSSPAGANA